MLMSKDKTNITKKCKEKKNKIFHIKCFKIFHLFVLLSRLNGLTDFHENLHKYSVIIGEDYRLR